MLKNIEEVAIASGLHLECKSGPWSADTDWPHIAPFQYGLSRLDEATNDLVSIGQVTGYRISHDWTVDDERSLLEEADALDGDVLAYVDALIREMRACNEVFDNGVDLTLTQRVTMVQHIEAPTLDVLRDSVASLAMMDAPTLMLVDARLMPADRGSASGKLKERSHASLLLELGFVRMVASPYLWAWNREVADSAMSDYRYETLHKAAKSGNIDGILKPVVDDDV